MTNEKLLLDIMTKTIASIENNKDSIVCIIKNLQEEYEKKKAELVQIKAQLPEILKTVDQLNSLDKQLRQRLASASSDFSNQGHHNLHNIFMQATNVHEDFLKKQEEERTLIRRRDALEIDLRQSLFNITQAESMAQQLIVSLSYLQTGVEQLKEHKAVAEHQPLDASLHHSLSFFKCLENEKSRIARDLHDGPAQQIASAQIRVDFCKSLIQRDLVQGLAVLNQLKSDLAGALHEVRDILSHLYPAPIEKTGLENSIRSLLYSTLVTDQLRLDFTYSLDQSRMSIPLQMTIYRLVQEITNNIKKHAHATQVTLRLSESSGFVYIYALDNGVGFQVPEDIEHFTTTKHSYGLANIHTRVKDLKGDLKITSSSKQGTLFKIQLPLLGL